MSFPIVKCSSANVQRNTRKQHNWPLSQLQPEECFVIPMQGDCDNDGRSSATIRGIVSAAGRRLGRRFSVTKTEGGDFAVSRWE